MPCCAVVAHPQSHPCSLPARPALPAASKAFLEGLRKLCDEADALLVFDEVQVGVGGGLPRLLGALNCQAAGC
jgi:glutamate-1-semialdehyde aminotransferase